MNAWEALSVAWSEFRYSVWPLVAWLALIVLTLTTLIVGPHESLRQFREMWAR